MKKKYLAFIAFGVALFAASCSKSKSDYTPPVISGSKTVAMGATWDNMVYVNLSTGDTVSRPMVGWDIAFQNSGGTAVHLNTGKKSGVYVISSTNFESITALPSGIKFSYDNAAGLPSGTVIGSWDNNGDGNSKNLVYIVNLGNNPAGSANSIGYKKIQIKGFSNNTYTLRYANLDGSSDTTVSITRTSDAQYSYFSMINNQKVSVEPPAGNWDILFTAITVAGGGPPGSYVTTLGVLYNVFNGTSIAVDDPASTYTLSDEPDAAINLLPDSISNYDKITKADFARIGASSDPLIMGNNWYQIIKPHTAGQYKVYNWRTYIIKNKAGQYFKLKFTAFKNLETGEKGYPSFSYQAL